MQSRRGLGPAKEQVMHDYTKIYVNGQWVSPLGGTTVNIVNPATEQPAGRISLATSADVAFAVKAARAAFKTFSLTTTEQRIELLQNIVGAYVLGRQELAESRAGELGAPAKFSYEQQSGTGLMHLMT